MHTPDSNTLTRLIVAIILMLAVTVLAHAARGDEASTSDADKPLAQWLKARGVIKATTIVTSPTVSDGCCSSGAKFDVPPDYAERVRRLVELDRYPMPVKEADKGIGDHISDLGSALAGIAGALWEWIKSHPAFVVIIAVIVGVVTKKLR